MACGVCGVAYAGPIGIVAGQQCRRRCFKRRVCTPRAGGTPGFAGKAKSYVLGIMVGGAVGAKRTGGVSTSFGVADAVACVPVVCFFRDDGCCCSTFFRDDWCCKFRWCRGRRCCAPGGTAWPCKCLHACFKRCVVHRCCEMVWR